jgi:hypothetical protein
MTAPEEYPGNPMPMQLKHTSAALRVRAHSGGKLAPGRNTTYGWNGFIALGTPVYHGVY